MPAVTAVEGLSYCTWRLDTFGRQGQAERPGRLLLVSNHHVAVHIESIALCSPACSTGAIGCKTAVGCPMLVTQYHRNELKLENGRSQSVK